VLLGKQEDLHLKESLALAACVGLGMLTKGTFFAYAAPILFWLFVPMLLRGRLKQLLLQGGAIAFFAAVLNAGFWARNIGTYGGPYGPSDVVRVSLGRIQALIPGSLLPEEPEPTAAPPTTPPVPAAGSSDDTDFVGQGSQDDAEAPADPEPGRRLAPVLESVARHGRAVMGMAGWNLVTPSSAINALIDRSLAAFPAIFSANYRDVLKQSAWNHEDTAGSPLHLLLLGWAILMLLAGRVHVPGTPARTYALIVVATYVLLPAVATAASGNWGLRYQLPFFLLACPLIALGINALGSQRLPGLASLFFIVTAVPYVLLNNTRPIIGHTPWPTRVRSVFVAPPQEILLAAVPQARESFTAIADEISQISCQRVGLRIDSDDLEYAFWWLLDAPQSGTRSETLYPLSSLDGLVDRSFKPCAVICSVCGDSRETLNGLELVLDTGVFKLFAGSSFSWQ
jgi:hypothetical protein